MVIEDKFWLIGFLEGEGSFLRGSPSAPNNPKIMACSTDEDVIARAAKILDCGYHSIKKQKEHHKPCWRLRKVGRKAVLIMQEIQSHMGLRRQGQIQRVLDSYNWDSLSPVERKVSQDTVLEIRKLCAKGNLTQKEIAERFSITREMVNKIHRRKRHACV